MAEPEVFYVYALLSPDTGLAHYVGKTFKITERFKQRVQKARRTVGHQYQPPKNRPERWLYELALERRERQARPGGGDGGGRRQAGPQPRPLPRPER